KKPKEMSGGQRQRVALGRAIVREPKVMLLDEPLSNLDAKLRTQMRAEISKLHKKLETTFIYVTHDQVEAMTMGTRIVVMKDGYVQQIDTPKNLYNYPANKFVAGFIGTPQMSFFEGTLKKEGEKVKIKFDCSDAEISVPYSMLYKAKPSSLDGRTKVYIGFRAEDVCLAAEEVGKADCVVKEDNKPGSAVIKVRISHSEELGSETLIYGEMYGGKDEGASSRIIIKDNSGREIRPGDVVDVALNIGKVHLFDKETEQSVLPRIPEYNYLDCLVKGGKLQFLGAELELPEAVRCADLKGELLLPVDAVTLDGNLKAEVVSCEHINGVNLLSLTLNGKRLFASSPRRVDEMTVNIGIDFKKITVLSDGAAVVSPLPEINGFDCSFVKRKTTRRAEANGKVKEKKTVEFGFAAAGAFFNATDEAAQKIFSALGVKKAFTSPLKMECGIYDIALSDSGIPAKAEQFLDYGEDKFLKCSAGGNTVFVKVDAECGGELFLAPDMDKIGISEKEKDIKII
ncbi:MAG: ATP-binding cassette domain-containing protein, partial [Clostridia bacterium]|nr:ATP-binding cassette domain-containing protein [Clostridia bacterium]